MKSLLVEGLLAVTLQTPKVPRDFTRVIVLRELEPPADDLLIKSARDLALGKFNTILSSSPPFISCSQ